MKAKTPLETMRRRYRLAMGLWCANWLLMAIHVLLMKPFAAESDPYFRGLALVMLAMLAAAILIMRGMHEEADTLDDTPLRSALPNDRLNRALMFCTIFGVGFTAVMKLPELMFDIKAAAMDGAYGLVRHGEMIFELPRWLFVSYVWAKNLRIEWMMLSILSRQAWSMRLLYLIQADGEEENGNGEK